MGHGTCSTEDGAEIVGLRSSTKGLDPNTSRFIGANSMNHGSMSGCWGLSRAPQVCVVQRGPQTHEAPCEAQLAGYRICYVHADQNTGPRKSNGARDTNKLGARGSPDTQEIADQSLAVTSLCYLCAAPLYVLSIPFQQWCNGSGPDEDG